MNDDRSAVRAEFPPLPVTGGSSAARRLKVCIASFDFVGPVRNGGVGTAFTSLGEALAAAGHEVTLLFVSGDWCENRTMEHWIGYYAEKNIRFVPLPKECPHRLESPWYTLQSYQAYLWLQSRPFDVIHFSEWKGPGYFSLLAKHQGLAFAQTLLCVHTHGPTLWHKLSNSEYVTDMDDLECDFVERRSVALADIVVSPSRYLFDWMTGQGWRLPADCHLQQYVQPATARQPRAERAAAAVPAREWVFFGRLEYRKGLVLFCDALDRLRDDPALGHLKVTFLGKGASINGVASEDYLRERAKRWPWVWDLIQDRDQAGAMDYLQGEGRLALMPSLVDNLPNTVLECLGARIPFLAGRAGGIPEMIAAEDCEQVLFELRPSALAEALRRSANAGVRAARCAVAPRDTEAAWLAWHQTQALQVRKPRAESALDAVPSPPLVSVCMAHWNRPHYLEQALTSLEAQDYPNLEVIVVDDCSDDPDALRHLERLESRFAARGWTLLRQPENRFPGAARNRAAQAARGEFLLFMDDDNVAKPNEVSTLIRVALRTGADILTCFLDTFSGREAPSSAQSINSRLLFLGDAVAGTALTNLMGDTNSLMKRQVFLELGGFHEQWGVNHEDYELMARAALKGYRLEVVPEALVYYRVNEGETSVLRSTPMHGNLMCSIRPYLEAVPPELRNLVLYAQGQYMRNSDPNLAQNSAAQAFAKHTIHWQSRLHAAAALVQAGQRDSAVQMLLESLQAAQASEHPGIVLEALLQVGKAMIVLDSRRARQSLQLAGQLAHNLKSNAAVKQADELLQILERSPVAAAHAFPTTPPAASVNLPGSSRDATTPQATARFAGSPDTPASDPVSDFDAVARQVARHLNADRDEAALELIQRALPSHPCRSRLYFGQALALARLGRAQDARRVLRQLPERERNAGKVRLLLEELEELETRA